MSADYIGADTEEVKGQMEQRHSAKPDCHQCRHARRSEWTGGHHVACKHPSAAPFDRNHKLGISGSAWGFVNGWFTWPIDFDPVWLDSCNGFEPKEQGS